MALTPERILRPRYDSDSCMISLHFDEGSGTVAKDYSGHGNDANIYGATWESGVISYCLKFDGVDDYAECNRVPTTNGITILFWISTTETRNWRYPLANGTTDPFSVGWVGWRFNLDIGGHALNFDLSESSSNFIRLSGSAINDGKWYFVAGWWDGSTAKLYINGVLNKSGLFSGNIENSSDIFIGSAVGPTGYCNCKIDELRIFTRPLSEDEIKAQMHGARYLPERVLNPERVLTI